LAKPQRRQSRRRLMRNEPPAPSRARGPAGASQTLAALFSLTRAGTRWPGLAHC